jgi:hypothetical protein
MGFDSPAWCMDATNQDAEQFRRAIGTLLGPAGGIVTPGDLTVTQQTVANMSVQIGTGQVWVPGNSTTSQGPYYSMNKAAVTQAINTASASNPRVDIVGVQIIDKAYAGAATTCAPLYVAGTPTAGATLGNLLGVGTVPASSLVLAYVLVPTSTSSIVTADILNVASVCSHGGAWTSLTLGTNWVVASPWNTAQARLQGDMVALKGALEYTGSGSSTAPGSVPSFASPAHQVSPAGWYGGGTTLTQVNINAGATALSTAPVPSGDSLILDGVRYCIS